MATITDLRPRLPGTLEGLVRVAEQAVDVVQEQEDALVELTGVLARIERHFEGHGGDVTVLLLDTRDALRLADLVREGVRPWLMRLGLR